MRTLSGPGFVRVSTPLQMRRPPSTAVAPRPAMKKAGCRPLLLEEGLSEGSGCLDGAGVSTGFSGDGAASAGFGVGGSASGSNLTSLASPALASISFVGPRSALPKLAVREALPGSRYTVKRALDLAER